MYTIYVHNIHNTYIFCDVYPHKKLFANEARKINLLQHVFL